MIFKPDSILKDVYHIEPTRFGDDRGYFFEAYHKDKFNTQNISCDFVQSNQSQSVQHVLRGLHFQRPPKQQAKLVRVLSGHIFDVAVDIRPGSSTFGQWTGYTLDSTRHNMLFIPNYCAHGFLVLSETATVLYHCDNTYAPELEQSIRYDDPDINIKWPLSATPILSSKDEAGIFLKSLHG